MLGSSAATATVSPPTAISTTAEVVEAGVEATPGAGAGGGLQMEGTPSLPVTARLPPPVNLLRDLPAD